MTIDIQAPFDLIQTTMRLPSPNLGDHISPQIKVNVRNSYDGTIYSTIKTNNRVKLEWEFNLTNAKVRELNEFILAYNTEYWRIYDWNETCYKVILVTNPIPTTPVGRNSVNVRLELEGTIVG